MARGVRGRNMAENSRLPGTCSRTFGGARCDLRVLLALRLHPLLAHLRRLLWHARPFQWRHDRRRRRRRPSVHHDGPIRCDRFTGNHRIARPYFRMEKSSTCQGGIAHAKILAPWHLHLAVGCEHRFGMRRLLLLLTLESVGLLAVAFRLQPLLPLLLQLCMFSRQNIGVSVHGAEQGGPRLVRNYLLRRES